MENTKHPSATEEEIHHIAASPTSKNVFPKSSRLLLYIFLIILFLISGIGAYFLGVNKASPKEINLQDWKRYSNPIVGYSVQYPPEYKLEENLTTYESVDFMPNGDTINEIINSKKYFISIQNTQIEETMTILDYWDQQVKNGNIRSQTVNKTTVAGKDAIEVSGTRTDAQDKTIYFIVNNWLTAIQLNFYTSTYEEGKKKFPDAEPSFYQMVKTFILQPQSQGKLFPTSVSFLNETAVSPTTVTNKAQANGVSLANIKYTLPTGWKAEINGDNLLLTPATGGGYLYVTAYDYPGTTGRREYYCKVRTVCIQGTTYFNEMNIGNISGYIANALDNSGGGAEYFGSKGNKFYVISSYNPPSPNDFENNYKTVLNSLIF